MSPKKTKSGNLMPAIAVEKLSELSESQTMISFDEFLAEKDNSEKCFNFKVKLTLPWLLEACKDLTRQTVQTELQFLEDKTGIPIRGLSEFYYQLYEQIEALSENEVIVQIGWGSGWRGMTGQLLKTEDLASADLRKNLRLADGYLSFPFPKSRRVGIVNNTYLPMGWIKLSFKLKGEDIKKRQQEKETKEREEESLDILVWESVHLSWSPGDDLITASFEGKKAKIKGKDIVPEHLKNKLFGKKKNATAEKVKVEPVGNGYRIIEIL